MNRKGQEMSELTVQIPIGDWETEYLEAEPKIDGPGALIELRKAHGIGSVSRMVAAARARNEAPADIIKPDKLLYHSGVKADIAEAIASHVEEAQLENGRTIKFRSFVATPPQNDGEGGGDDGEDVIVDAVSNDGLERAQRYLVRNVPGYVYGRLAIIAANQGNVREAAQGLVDAVWGMVERLEEPSTL